MDRYQPFNYTRFLWLELALIIVLKVPLNANQSIDFSI